MAQKILKAKKRKVAPKKAAEKAERKIVLVGTYKAGQLAWIGKHLLYNYPVREGDKFDATALGKVSELWLYAGTKGTRHCYEAKFVRQMTREEWLKENPTYANLGRGRSPSAPTGRGMRPACPPHKAYYVFKVKPLEYGTRFDAPEVITRVRDFGGRSSKIKKAIEQYEKDGKFAPLAAYLPTELSQVPQSQLRVCEPWVQMEFMVGLIQKKNQKSSSMDFFKNVRDVSVAESLGIAEPLVANGFTHVDCFSGVGGFCTGLHAAGFTTKVAIEKIKSCVETYEINHPEVHVINNDICKVTADEITPYCPKGGVDLVTSGMPCETFSTAGNTSRSFYDERQFLFRQGIRVAKITHAKFLLFENVPAITTKTARKGGEELIVDILKHELVSAGYRNYIEVVLDSTRFGVPQRRKRYFVLATRLPSMVLKKPTSTLRKEFTVGDAFADLPSVQPNTWVEGRKYLQRSNPFTDLMRNDSFWRRQCATSEITYQMPMKHRPATLERFRLLRPGEGLKDLFDRYAGSDRERLQARHVLPRKMFIKRNYRLPVGQPSPTVTSHCLDEFVHPVEDRALTVRECARLQSFPDSYDFKGGPYIVPHIDREVQDKYEQIGDAVPPLLAYAWGRVISEMLKEIEK